jgi:cyclic beta-1,2-glucan synthetase
MRENGGQYSHAATWAVRALAELGEGDKAADLFALLNPVNHARTPEEVERYKVEPYVIAADVYSVPPHVGRGGWTWYTGSAGWMYRAGMESILGISREGDSLVVNPCIPASWPGFEAKVQIGSTCYKIRVETPSRRCRGVSRIVLDGSSINSSEGHARVPLDGGTHSLLISI